MPDSNTYFISGVLFGSLLGAIAGILLSNYARGDND